MKLNSLSRRRLLKGTGVAAGALAAGRTWAAETDDESAARVIFVYVPSGALPEYWHPQGCGDQFALNEMTAPFEPVKEHCTFLQGIDLVNFGHGNVRRLLNPNGEHSQSLDVRLAAHLNSPLVLPLSAVDAINESLTINDSGSFPPIANMQRAFDHFFADEQFDSALFDHFTRGDIANDFTDFEVRSKQMMELAVLALQHDKARVASLHLGDDQGTFRLPSLGMDYDYALVIHAMESPEKFIAFRRFLSARVAYLIQLLAATKDKTGAPLIDSTLVVQVTDMGDGTKHDANNAPLMLAGGKRFIKNGIAYRASAGGYTNKEVLDTVCAAMGFNDGAAYGNGPITDLLI